MRTRHRGAADHARATAQLGALLRGHAVGAAGFVSIGLRDPVADGLLRGLELGRQLLRRAAGTNELPDSTSAPTPNPYLIGPSSDRGWAYCHDGKLVGPVWQSVLTQDACQSGLDKDFCFNRFEDLNTSSSYDTVGEALDFAVNLIPDALEPVDDMSWGEEMNRAASTEVRNDDYRTVEDWSCPGKQHAVGYHGSLSGCL